MGKPPGCRKSKCRCPDIRAPECYAGGVADTAAYEGHCYCDGDPDGFRVRNLAFDYSDIVAGMGDPSMLEEPGVTCFSGGWGGEPVKIDWTLLITSQPVLSCKCMALTEAIEIPIDVSWDADERAWLGYTDTFPHQDNPDGYRLWVRVSCDCKNQGRINLWITDSGDNQLDFDLSDSQAELTVVSLELVETTAGDAVGQTQCIPLITFFPWDEWLHPTPYAPRAWDGRWPNEYAVTITGPDCVDGTFVLECCAADCADFPVNAFIRNYDFAPSILDPGDRIELRTYHTGSPGENYVWVVFAIGDSFARYKILKTDFQPWGENTLDFEDSSGVDCSGWPATVTLEFQS